MAAVTVSSREPDFERDFFGLGRLTPSPLHLRGAARFGELGVLDCVTRISMWAGRGMAGFEVEGSGAVEVREASLRAAAARLTAGTVSGRWSSSSGWRTPASRSGPRATGGRSPWRTSQTRS
jgi:hypothetical protein